LPLVLSTDEKAYAEIEDTVGIIISKLLVQNGHAEGHVVSYTEETAEPAVIILKIFSRGVLAETLQWITP